MIGITDALRDARINATLALLDAGAGTPQLLVYAAPRPAAGYSPSAPPLAVIDLARPIGSVAAGVLTLSAAAPAVATQSGQAAWARITNADGAPMIDASVSDTAGAGEVKLTTTALITGASVALIAATLV